MGSIMVVKDCWNERAILREPVQLSQENLVEDFTYYYATSEQNTFIGRVFGVLVNSDNNTIKAAGLYS